MASEKGSGCCWAREGLDSLHVLSAYLIVPVEVLESHLRTFKDTECGSLPSMSGVEASQASLAWAIHKRDSGPNAGFKRHFAFVYDAFDSSFRRYADVDA